MTMSGPSPATTPHQGAPPGLAPLRIPVAPVLAASILAAALSAAASLAPTAAVAASQADEDACRPDVFRICASAIPDEDAIVACLEAHSGELGTACHAVMAPAPPASRRRRIGAW